MSKVQMFAGCALPHHDHPVKTTEGGNHTVFLHQTSNINLM